MHVAKQLARRCLQGVTELVNHKTLLYIMLMTFFPSWPGKRDYRGKMSLHKIYIAKSVTPKTVAN